MALLNAPPLPLTAGSEPAVCGLTRRTKDLPPFPAVPGQLAAVVGYSYLRWRKARCVARWCRPTRREALLLFPFADPAHAETLSDLSRGITGGDKDVYYPTWFKGIWEATTELVAVEVPENSKVEDSVKRQQQLLGTKQAVERYPQKYIEYEGKIIADRAFNMRSYVRGSGGGPRAFESVEWDPRTPNLSTVTIKRDGVSIKTETRIKKRTVGVPEGRDDLFNSSEVFLQEVSGGGEDKVTPIRCVNKFKKNGDSEILVIQRLEIFPRFGGADPEAFNLDKPSVIYKYRG
ncbi:unnamed protein product, partial [Effrenium voratum]